MGAKVNGVPLPLKFDKPEVLYNFPITYGSRDTSDSQYSANIPGLGYYGEKRHRENYVDGWGVLYLPSNTFNVIRVKSKVTYYDSIYYDSIGYGGGFTRTVTEYKWLIEGFHEPVLQITKQSQNIVSVRYFDDAPLDLGVSHIEKNTVLEVFPNPVCEVLYVNNPFINQNTDITIANVSGREIFTNKYSKSRSRIEIPVEQLQKGIYLITLNSASGQYNGKFIKE